MAKGTFIFRKVLILAAISSLYSCFPTTSTESSGTYEVSLAGDDLKYVPNTSNQVDDPTYMTNIDNLIEEKVAAISSDADFLDIVKAIAWTESTWKHYYQENGKYYVYLGDSGHSYGMMQIYDTYHGEHPVLQDNISYGAQFAYEKFQTAVVEDCPSGTNAGTDLIGIARRTYAQYNGGNSAICRDNDARDNNLEDALTNKPWLNYL
ncbi:MAG: hypothetical protein V1647_04200 [Pseudomonadota bacterium]